MKMAPETRVIEDPMLAERVRGVRYEPQRYNEHEEKERERRASSKSKVSDPLPEPKPQQTQAKEEVKKQGTPTSGRNYESQKRAWTTSSFDKEKEKTKNF